MVIMNDAYSSYILFASITGIAISTLAKTVGVYTALGSAMIIVVVFSLSIMANLLMTMTYRCYGIDGRETPCKNPLRPNIIVVKQILIFDHVVIFCHKLYHQKYKTNSKSILLRDHQSKICQRGRHWIPLLDGRVSERNFDLR